MMGPPGSGKGTQALSLKNRYGWSWLSMGDLLRGHVEQATELGKVAHSFMKEGHLVPDHLLEKIILSAIEDSQTTSKAVIVDGYPRTLSQAQLLGQSDYSISIIIHLQLSFEGLQQRIASRAELEHREDDTLDKLKIRMDAYEHHIQPLVQYYRSQRLDVYHVVDASGTREDVYQRIENILRKHTSFMDEWIDQ